MVFDHLELKKLIFGHFSEKISNRGEKALTGKSDDRGPGIGPDPRQPCPYRS